MYIMYMFARICLRRVVQRLVGDAIREKSPDSVHIDKVVGVPDE
jgi:hypothetical protein